jgi:hypothetical protein
MGETSSFHGTAGRALLLVFANSGWRLMLDSTANTVLALAALDWENCGRKILLGAHSGRNFAKS